MKYPNLVAEMAKSEISRAQVARRLGVRPNTVSAWLTDKHEITVGMAFEIRDEFFPGMSIDYLFGGDDS